MPSIPIEKLAAYVVKESVRQIRNGQVQLKQLGINCEPELEIAFNVTVHISGGLNAITRTTTGSTDQTQVNGARVTDQTSEQKQESNDTNEQVFGRTTTTEIIYES